MIICRLLLAIRNALPLNFPHCSACIVSLSHPSNHAFRNDEGLCVGFRPNANWSHVGLLGFLGRKFPLSLSFVETSVNDSPEWFSWPMIPGFARVANPPHDMRDWRLATRTMANVASARLSIRLSPKGWVPVWVVRFRHGWLTPDLSFPRPRKWQFCRLRLRWYASRRSLCEHDLLSFAMRNYWPSWNPPISTVMHGWNGLIGETKVLPIQSCWIKANPQWQTFNLSNLQCI